MSEADAATKAAEQSKGPPSLDPKLTDAQTIKKNPEPLPKIPAEQRVFPPLLLNRFAIAEFRNMRKWVCVPDGTPIERILMEDYWAQVSNSLAICDTIEVHCDDRSFYAEVYVRDKGRNWAKVSLIKHIKFEGAVEVAAADPAYDVAFKGPVNKWCLVRKADGEIIKDKCETKEAAQSALAQYVRGLGR